MEVSLLNEKRNSKVTRTHLWKVYTDGSYIPNTMYGGWAFSITSDLLRVKILSSMASAFNESYETELAGIFNALVYVNRLILEDNFTEKVFSDDRHIIEIRSDCKDAINTVNLAIAGRLPLRHVCNLSKSIKSMFGIIPNATVVALYVPAHSKLDNDDARLNNEVDNEAKRAVNTLRASH